jgi:methyltransferase (TIGR00027 family)
MEQPDLSALARTACWTAAVRAHESERADLLFRDPWASQLAGAEGEMWWHGLSPQQRDGAAIFQPIRTRFFDDLLGRTTRNDQIRQVILLAAGLDTRAFRLSWPEGTRLFELDQPTVLAEKMRLLGEVGAEAACERISVGVDLRVPSWPDHLRAAGFVPQERSVWLLEGFLVYLEEDEVLHLLDEVSALAAAGSQLGFDVLNHAMLTASWRRDAQDEMRQVGARQRSAMDEPERVLGQRGWRVSVVQPGEETASYGRWPLPVPPRSLPDLPDIPRSFLVTAERQGS